MIKLVDHLLLQCAVRTLDPNVWFKTANHVVEVQDMRRHCAFCQNKNKTGFVLPVKYIFNISALTTIVKKLRD